MLQTHYRSKIYYLVKILLILCYSRFPFYYDIILRCFFVNFPYSFLHPILHKGSNIEKPLPSLFYFLIASAYKSTLGVPPDFMVAYVLISPTGSPPFYFLSRKRMCYVPRGCFSLQNSLGSALTDLDIQEGVSSQD